jgi:exonuclease III
VSYGSVPASLFDVSPPSVNAEDFDAIASAVGGVVMQAILLNIRHGGGPRAQRLLEWVTRRSPDVVVMAEWQDGAPGAVLKAGLEAKGFQTATATTNGDANGVLVAAKRPFAFRCATPLETRERKRVEGRGGALLVADFDGLRMLAAYFPGAQAKRPFFEACMAEAEASRGVPFVLVGDLNTGRNDLDVEGTGTPFVCADQFEELTTRAGLVDLWRAQHGDTAQDWSWRSQKNGFRIDHAFANAAFRERFPGIRCRYDHEPREMKISDHSALVIVT